MSQFFSRHHRRADYARRIFQRGRHNFHRVSDLANRGNVFFAEPLGDAAAEDDHFGVNSVDNVRREQT